MILISLMLMQAAYTPETEAVMNRSRQQAQERRIEQRRVDVKQAEQKAQAQASDQAPPSLPPEIAAKLQACIDTGIDDPAAGIRFAQEWAMDGGSFSARQCKGFAEARSENWQIAATDFESAANEAQKSGASAHAARLFAQAGNAALAGGKAEQARGYFDAALGHGLPDGMEKGELYLDRARALVAVKDNMGARRDIDVALKMAPEDPLGWLLSATLARRQQDLARAANDISEAKKRAPDDASVALEEGNIAILSDDEAAAKAAWHRVLTLSPDSDQAKQAKASLTQLEGQEATVVPPPAKP